VRRLVLLTVVAVLGLTVGIAYAVTDTLTYTGTGSHKGTPSTKKPANFTYTGTLSVDTNPPGQQPDVAPTTSVYFAKGIKRNGAYFPSCTQSEIDGKPSFPAKCNKAVVGTGTATAYAGQPGGDRTQSIVETLNVKAVNGPKGKLLFLVLNSTPDAPVAIINRIVPGTVVGSSGSFAFYVRFDIPQNLQEPVPGVKVALAYFNVKISGTAHTLTINKKKVKASYLQLTSCKGKMSAKAITTFDNNGTPTPVTATSTGKC
jgi:hypothetical protein